MRLVGPPQRSKVDSRHVALLKITAWGRAVEVHILVVVGRSVA